MPKSRHEQFENAWSSFMESIDRTDYELISLTKNKTCRDHTYHLELPHRSELFRIDRHNPAQDNEVGYVDNPRMTTETLDKFVEEFFSPYFLSANGIVQSYVDTRPYAGETKPDCDIYVINIAYYKSHLPFPIKLTKMQNLIKKNRELEEKIESMEDIIENTIHQLDAARHSAESVRRRMRIDRRTTKEKYVGLMEKMREKLAGYYKDTNQQEDCPVCYETIDASKLKIPACCHYICTSCADRCAPQQCPMCRVEFA
jgi:DNA repair exonuclease SbcCD ATPase subunit